MNIFNTEQTPYIYIMPLMSTNMQHFSLYECELVNGEKEQKCVCIYCGECDDITFIRKPKSVTIQCNKCCVKEVIKQ